MKQNRIFVVQPFGNESDAVFSLITSKAAKENASMFRDDSIIAGVNIIEPIY